jgi:very-short-patch-repair endonuclease
MPSHHPIPAVNRANARRMRKAMTPAELKLWKEVRAHRLMGISFRRQLPIGAYIVDFACPEKMLIVEIDGSQHGDDVRAEADAARTRFLENAGWTVLRFWNHDVIDDITNVCQHIVIAAGLAGGESDTTFIEAAGRPA